MKIGRFISCLSLSVLLLMPFTVMVASAATSGSSKTSSSSSKTDGSATAAGGGSVQGYAANSTLQIGTIVQLLASSNGAAKVAAASSKNLNQMYGVVVDPHEQSLTISNSNLSNETYVATSGTYAVLVSTQGGPIAAGDYITQSAIDGVGMKAGTDEPTVFGRAVTTFTGKNGLGNISLKDSAGNSKTVTLGLAQVSINIQRNPNKKSTKADLPKVLQRLGQAIAEKPIGPMRIYLSIAITGLSIIVALVTLYAGIRNAIIAIGRNPLSKKSIFRGLLEIILTSFLILIIGLFAVYLLLKL
ncbi:MAG TPA: hypothetical protein VLF69_05955 [Candidatus Saccharimonadales bacterium]|nr:hypothetical protein [Candidatus Saccharimonadales bacterium]